MTLIASEEFPEAELVPSYRAFLNLQESCGDGTGISA